VPIDGLVRIGAHAIASLIALSLAYEPLDGGWCGLVLTVTTKWRSTVIATFKCPESQLRAVKCSHARRIRGQHRKLSVVKSASGGSTGVPNTLASEHLITLAFTRKSCGKVGRLLQSS
jgi:hypothetical protein